MVRGGAGEGTDQLLVEAGAAAASDRGGVMQAVGGVTSGPWIPQMVCCTTSSARPCVCRDMSEQNLYGCQHGEALD